MALCKVMTTLLLISAGLLFHSAISADPDPLQDFCVADLSRSDVTINGFVCKNSSLATIDDFVFSGLANSSNTSNAFNANSVLGTVLVWPALNTLGLSIARLDFAKGGIIPPHTHPLASEMVYVEEGSLYAGFVTQDNKLFAKVIHKGDVMVFPRALIHWQLNVGNSTAKAIATLNSQKFDAQIVANSLFGTAIEDEVLEKSFFLDKKIVRELRSRVKSILSGN